MQGLSRMNTQSEQAYRTGELLVKEGLIHPDDVQTALAIQEKRAASVSLNKSRYLGMILCDLNLITPIDNYAVLYKHNKLISLPAALVQKKVVSPERMQAIEEQSLREDLPLISLLINTNVVSMQTLQQMLYDLFHIPFRSISDFIFNENDRQQLIKMIGEEQSKENGIIPMVIKDNTVLFGVTAPENLLLIHTLNHNYPQYRFKVLFITLSGFNWFHDIIYNGRRPAAAEKKEPQQPDISLLLGYKTVLRDPADEPSAVRTLYQQYETLRTLLGNRAAVGRQKAFSHFIFDAHKRIIERTETRKIEFSFEKQGRDVMIIATPKRLDKE